MARLKSEIEVTCPCCQTTLVVDTNLGRIVSHKEPERGDKPELNDAQRIVAEQAARREAMFQQSVNAEKTRSDVLSKRFEEALRQAKDEPVTKPMRERRRHSFSDHHRLPTSAAKTATIRILSTINLRRRIPPAIPSIDVCVCNRLACVRTGRGSVCSGYAADRPARRKNECAGGSVRAACARPSTR
jgi:hypothetical protein